MKTMNKGLATNVIIAFIIISVVAVIIGYFIGQMSTSGVVGEWVYPGEGGGGISYRYWWNCTGTMYCTVYSPGSGCRRTSTRC